jgi:hypothetical protein
LMKPGTRKWSEKKHTKSCIHKQILFTNLFGMVALKGK